MSTRLRVRRQVNPLHLVDPEQPLPQVERFHETTSKTAESHGRRTRPLSWPQSRTRITRHAPSKSGPVSSYRNGDACSGGTYHSSPSSEAPVPPPAEKPKIQRKQSVDPATAERLEKSLAHRPDKNELIDRNILKDDTVAPALQAAKEKLQRSQLEDKLEHALQARPKPEELVKDGILKDSDIPPV
ncbi:hypothetical protein C8Q80DRAFT_860608 [Daedaleopsis nitida]|nr:hypothetical protein C8Q80DRAFT_860608 [Daedaleopsis nitida]